MLAASLKVADELKDDLLKELALKTGYAEKLEGREIEDVAKHYPGRAVGILRSYNQHAHSLQWNLDSKKFEYRIKAPFLAQVIGFGILYFACSVPATFLLLRKVVPVIPTIQMAPEYIAALIAGSMLWLFAIASVLMVFNLFEARQFARKINRDFRK